MNAVTKMVETVTITVETTVDPEWVDLCTKYNDLFIHGYCGYWMRGYARTDKLGWLVRESDDDDPEKAPAEVLKAWRAGEPLPQGWHRLDIDMARKAWVEGFKRDGQSWFENGDANTYDNAVQLAMLGEVRYG